jgi:hypothetical protein
MERELRILILEEISVDMVVDWEIKEVFLKL